MACNFCESQALNKCEFKGCNNVSCMRHCNIRKIEHYGTAVTSVSSNSYGQVSSTSQRFVSHVEEKKYCQDCNQFLNFMSDVKDYKNPDSCDNCLIQSTLLGSFCCCLCCLVVIPQVYSLNKRSTQIKIDYPKKVEEFNRLVFLVNDKSLYFSNISEKMNTAFIVQMTCCSIGDSFVEKPNFQIMV